MMCHALKYGKCTSNFRLFIVSSDSPGFCCDSEYLEVFYISGQAFINNTSDISLVKNGNAEGKFSVHN